MLEGEWRQALAGVGFDLMCGFLHADKDGRGSLIYDLMEPFRPHVDSLVLAFIARTTFTYGDFVKDGAGQCRLHPQLARAVVAACRLPQLRIDTGARSLRTLLLDGVTPDGVLYIVGSWYAGSGETHACPLQQRMACRSVSQQLMSLRLENGQLQVERSALGKRYFI